MTDVTCDRCHKPLDGFDPQAESAEAPTELLSTRRGPQPTCRASRALSGRRRSRRADARAEEHPQAPPGQARGTPVYGTRGSTAVRGCTPATPGTHGPGQHESAHLSASGGAQDTKVHYETAIAIPSCDRRRAMRECSLERDEGKQGGFRGRELRSHRRTCFASVLSRFSRPPPRGARRRKRRRMMAASPMWMGYRSGRWSEAGGRRAVGPYAPSSLRDPGWSRLRALGIHSMRRAPHGYRVSSQP